jgi:hypothetical protein
VSVVIDDMPITESFMSKIPSRTVQHLSISEITGAKNGLPLRDIDF